MRVTNEYCWKWDITVSREFWIPNWCIPDIIDNIKNGKSVEEAIKTFCIEHCYSLPPDEIFTQVVDTIKKDFLTVK